MARAKKGQAISLRRRSPSERRRLRALLVNAVRSGDHKTWRRAKAVLGYIKGDSVISLSEQLGVTRGSINRWLQWFEADGTNELRPRKSPGRPPRLTEKQLVQLTTIVERGPQAAGYTSGMWTGPMVGDWIHRRFGVKYHNHHIPRLLHKLGFSVQRPRKRLARANAELQEYWVKKRLPAIKKKPLLAAA